MQSGVDEVSDWVRNIVFFNWASFFMPRQALVCLGLLIVDVLRSHSDTPHSVGFLWTSDRPVAEMST
jgi:hypothetical protein